MVHTASGIAKRLCAPRTARKLRSAFALTGYASLLVLLPIHYLVHRVYPSDPASPVYALAPAELDELIATLAPITAVLVAAGSQ